MTSATAVAIHLIPAQWSRSKVGRSTPTTGPDELTKFVQLAAGQVPRSPSGHRTHGRRCRTESDDRGRGLRDGREHTRSLALWLYHVVAGRNKTHRGPVTVGRKNRDRPVCGQEISPSEASVLGITRLLGGGFACVSVRDV